LPTIYQYPEDYTNFAFANGTMLPVENYAFFTSSTWFTDIVDGKTFTDFFCITPAQESTSSSPLSNTTSTPSSTPTSTMVTGTTAPTLLGYPYSAVTKDPNNQVA
jgi:type IV secretory pathway TraG/TraD family ATPase VirD4